MSNITDYYNDLTAIPGVPPSQAAAVAVTQSLSDDVLIDGFIRIVEAGYEEAFIDTGRGTFGKARAALDSHLTAPLAAVAEAGASPAVADTPASEAAMEESEDEQAASSRATSSSPAKITFFFIVIQAPFCK